jgi:uncharacterized protein YkwD
MKAGKIILAALVSALVFAPMSVMAAPKTMPDGTLFDAEYYAANNPDVVAAFGTSEAALYAHYQTFGRREGRLPVAPPASQTPAPTTTTTTDATAFDAAYYAARYPDVVAALGNDPAMMKAHYDLCGKAEGRFANAAQEQAATRPAATTTTNPSTLSQQEMLDFAYRLVDYINQERVNAGLTKIERSNLLVEASFIRARELPEKYSHTRPNGVDWKTVLSQVGVHSDDVHEFYVAGVGTPEEAARYFLRYKDDREILLKNGTYTRLGAGFAFDASEKGCYWVLIIMR